MSQLRYVGIKLEVKGDDAKTKMIKFNASVKDVDKAVDNLSETMGENVKVTAKLVKSETEIKKSAQATVRAFEASERKVATLTRNYAHLTDKINTTKEQQEVLNAVHRLGANATEKQKQKVTLLVTQYQKARIEGERLAIVESRRKQFLLGINGATDNATAANMRYQKSLRNTRGVAQNFGWQLQDTIVQLQMGTSAFTVLSQQGSQMASAFGPSGAILGAVIALGGAVGGVLFKGLMDTTKATDNLYSTMEILSSVIYENDKAVKQLSRSYFELTKENEDLARAQYALAKIQANRSLVAAKKLVDENSSSIEGWVTNIDDAARGLRQLEKDVNFSTGDMLNPISDINALGETTDRLKDKFKISNVEARELIKTLSDVKTKNTVESFNNLDRLIADLAISTGGTNKNFNDFALAMGKVSTEGRDSVESLLLLGKTYEDFINKPVEEETKKRTGANKKQLKSLQDLVLAWEEKEIALDRTNREQALNDAQMQLTKNSLIDEAGILEETVNLYQDRVEAIAQEKAASAALKQVLNERYAMRKKDNDLAEKELQRIEQAQSKQRGVVDPVAVESNQFGANQEELLFQKQQALREHNFAETVRLNQLMEGEQERHESVLQQLARQTLISQLENAAGFMTNVNTIVNQLAQVSEKGSEEAKALFYLNKALAFASTIIDTEAAAMKAVGQLGVFGLPLSATIKATGYASAGVIAGTTFTGAYDKGGYIPNGSSGIVSEYGNELVNGVMVKGPARVTGREETASMMGGQPNINIYTLPGTTAEVTQRENGQVDVRMRVIAEEVFANNIDSGVAGVVNNANSKTNKSFKRQYSVGRNL